MVPPLLISQNTPDIFNVGRQKVARYLNFWPWLVKRYVAVDINMFTLIPICMQDEKGSANEDFISIIVSIILASDT